MLFKLLIAGVILLGLAVLLAGCDVVYPVTDAIGITSVEQDEIKAHNKKMAEEEKENQEKCSIVRNGYTDYPLIYKTKLINKAIPYKFPEKGGKWVRIAPGEPICSTQQDFKHVQDISMNSNGIVSTSYRDNYSRDVAGTSCIILNYANPALGFVLEEHNVKGTVVMKVIWRNISLSNYFEDQIGWVSENGVIDYDMYSKSLAEQRKNYRKQYKLPDTLPIYLKDLRC